MKSKSVSDTLNCIGAGQTKYFVNSSIDQVVKHCISRFIYFSLWHMAKVILPVFLMSAAA